MRNSDCPVDKKSPTYDALSHVLCKTVPEAEEQVRRSVTRYNNIVRDHLRNETGLRHTTGNDSIGVPIRYVSGLPKAFLDATQDVTDPLKWRLILNERLLKTTLDGLDFLLEYVAETRQHPIQQVILNEDFSLDGSRSIVLGLLRQIEETKMAERFKAINEDVLGAYFYKKPEVQLYWMVIAAVSAMLSVSIESLTVVVLTHELAHAYTHLGKDIDGQSWRTQCFEDADSHIVEGLAQYYTEVICRNLALRYPSAKSAFESLLNMQAEPYFAHENWAKDSKQRGEAIRATMIIARSSGITCAQTFKKLVEQCAAEVRGNS